MSKTTENLEAAFSGESQARNKYTFFAKVARKQGYHYIAKIFEETAENERQHAKDHLKMLGGIGDTTANLKAAIGGEDYEVKDMLGHDHIESSRKYLHIHTDLMREVIVDEPL